MLCKRKCKYNISIVSSVSARPVNKNCILKKKKKINPQTRSQGLFPGTRMINHTPVWKHFNQAAQPGGGGGSLHMKGVGMLVVGSFRGVNFGFWSHLLRLRVFWASSEKIF